MRSCSMEAPKMFHILKIQLHDSTLLPLYSNHRPAYPDDAGIDLFVPKSVIIPARSAGIVIKLGVSVELTDCQNNGMSYFLLARSSSHLTSLRCQTSVIDAGFRGELSVVIDNISDTDYEIKQHQRLVQVCAPDLKPIVCVICSTLSKGSRGSKGFGSSGVTFRGSPQFLKMAERPLTDKELWRGLTRARL